MGANGDEERPSPELVAARLVIGDLNVALVPTWASWWIVNGHDGSAVVSLAGLSGSDPFDVREALLAALTEIEVAIPSLADAWPPVAHDRASSCLAGIIDELDLAAWVERVYIDSSYDSAVLAEPLGEIHGIDDEHRGRWGRTDVDLRRAVRTACRAQVGL